MKITVHPIHFEDFSGQQFERLSFAYVLNKEEWDSIDWYGQLGSDRGRDIWGVLSNSGYNSTVCYQCANHQKLNFDKAKEDIDKICGGPSSIPSKFILILGGRVSANMKSRITEYAKSSGIRETQIWSGTEFEERLRKDTPSLIRRFCEGVPFPEQVEDLATFILEGKKFNDDTLLAAYASCFDRPAFTTPFHQESNLPHFKKAISDTIEALQTGVHRLRDGTVIKRFPSINEINDSSIQDNLRIIVVDLQKLRSTYEDLLKKDEIRLCGCGQDDCPVHILSPKACHEMDRLRSDILKNFGKIYSKFKVKMW